MEFVRKKIRGQSQKSRKTWLSEEGYRIVWRNEVCGVSVAPGFQATVRTTMPSGEIWDFVDQRHTLQRTMKAAQTACEKHYKLWTKASEAGVRERKKLVGTPLGTPAFIK